MLTANKILSFLTRIKFPVVLPAGVEVMNPFADAETRRVCNLFYHKYYNDRHCRYAIVGINPGRFGGGITGIPFTDPIRLETVCQIENTWIKKQELSSVFIYEMMAAFGGAKTFYNKFYFTSVSPLGFTRQGKNLNYYDDKIVADAIVPFALACFARQSSWLDRSVAFCLGEGKNFAFLQHLNQKHQLFDRIVPLPHPRFIMQYRLRTKDNYISGYLDKLAMAGADK